MLGFLHSTCTWAILHPFICLPNAIKFSHKYMLDQKWNNNYLDLTLVYAAMATDLNFFFFFYTLWRERDEFDHVNILTYYNIYFSLFKQFYQRKYKYWRKCSANMQTSILHAIKTTKCTKTINVKAREITHLFNKK